MAIETTLLTRSLKRLELALAIVVVAVLVAVFMQRVDHVANAAEQAMLTARLQDMQARLMSLRTEFVAGARTQPLSLDAVVDFIDDGDIARAPRQGGFDWAAMQPGSWVYFRDTRELVYRATAPLPGTRGSPPRVYFQIVPVAAANVAGAQGGDTHGARLERLSSSEGGSR